MTVFPVIRLKDLLRTKLVECGWRDGMKNYCRGEKLVLMKNLQCKFLFAEIIKSKGTDNITLEELLGEITPKGRGTKNW